MLAEKGGGVASTVGSRVLTPDEEIVPHPMKQGKDHINPLASLRRQGIAMWEFIMIFSTTLDSMTFLR